MANPNTPPDGWRPRSTAGVLGGLKGQIGNLPRDEVGGQNALALEFAYQRCEALVDAALMEACGMAEPGPDEMIR